MQRKVIKQGNNTLTITLPKKWVDRVGVKVGDELQVIEDKGVLQIGKEQQEVEKEAQVTLQPPLRFASRKIFSLFRRGYDTIHVSSSNPEVLRAVSRWTNTMMGFDIIRQTEKGCVIKRIAKIDVKEFEQLLRRLFLVTITLAKDSYEAIVQQRYSALEEIKQLESTQNKLYVTCQYMLQKQGLAIAEDPYSYYLLLKKLEEIGDQLKYVCSSLASTKPERKIGSEVLSVYQKTISQLELFHRFFYSFHEQEGIALLTNTKELIQQSHQLLASSKKEESILLHRLLSILEHIRVASGNPTFCINEEKFVTKV